LKPGSIAKPYQPIQIVDTPESSETILNTALTALLEQTNRTLVAGPTKFAENAMRFLNGTPNVPALYSARSGYEIIQEIGVERIRAKSLRQTQLLMDLADEAGIPVRTCREAGQRAGVVILDVPNGKEATQELARREILVDYRPQAGIRVAPHFYTTDEEVQHTVKQLCQITSAVRR
jgi:kynureninase